VGEVTDDCVVFIDSIAKKEFDTSRELKSKCRVESERRKKEGNSVTGVRQKS
jgi:hypothetical protein